ncbi:unnamed protein product, partial [marine sediment metagenome]
YLSFTPKVEDLIVVLKWINIYGVPHYYVQVFFDAIYIISFSKILKLLKNASIEIKGRKNKKFFGRLDENLTFIIEKNPKNQFKETIHIFVNQGYLISSSFVKPDLIAKRKELASGRLLHYISFIGGDATIDKNILIKLIEKPF